MLDFLFFVGFAFIVKFLTNNINEMLIQRSQCSKLVILVLSNDGEVKYSFSFFLLPVSTVMKSWRAFMETCSMCTLNALDKQEVMNATVAYHDRGFSRSYSGALRVQYYISYGVRY